MKVIENVRKLLNKVIDNSLQNKCYFVGGCVRDYILDKDPNDIDIVVNVKGGSKKLAFDIFNLYKEDTTKPYRLGHYPIWSITFKDRLTLQISQTMRQQFNNKKSRQRKVFFSSLEDDIFRRDFSINSGLINITSGQFINISPTCYEDIQNGLIRCNVGIDKDKIFSEDPLRILRGIIFHIRFNWQIEQQTKQAMIRNSNRLKIIARERINTQIQKALNIQKGAYKLIKTLNQLDMLRYIFPHINNQKEVYQCFITSKNEYISDSRGIHLQGNTVFDHTLQVLKHTKVGKVNGLCAIFHDIGKTNLTRTQHQNGTVGFIGHDVLGAKYLQKVLKNFYKLDNETVNKIVFVCKNHMKVYGLLDSGIKPKRKFVKQTTKQYRQILYDLCNADTEGNVKDERAVYSCLDDKFIKQIQSISEQVIKYKKNILNGIEIMQIFNLQPGKQVGKIIKKLEDIQYQFGESLTKEKAIELLREGNKDEL